MKENFTYGLMRGADTYLPLLYLGGEQPHTDNYKEKNIILGSFVQILKIS